MTENKSGSGGDFTPMMNQYLAIKREYRDAILFFRLGDFYEMFFDDAKIASQALGLTLTSREAGRNQRVPMCGIPYHAADNYIARLIKQSFKIAICEQVEDPKLAKGIVRREIIRVITPGTLVNQSELDRVQNNYLVAVCAQPPESYGLAVVDLSTGEFRVTQIDGEEKLLSELCRLAPAELLLSSPAPESSGLAAKIKQRIPAAITPVEGWTFEFTGAYDRLTSHLKTQNLKGYGCEEMPLAVGAAGAALRYLEDTQKTELRHVNRITTYFLSRFMILDANAQRNLELVRSRRGDRKGTLLETLNFTQTPMGGRLLVQWIQQPLLEPAEIGRRLDAVEELAKTEARAGQLRSSLKKITDIERLLSRLSIGTANARDLFALNESLKVVPELKDRLGEVRGELLVSCREGMSALAELTGLVDRAIRPDAPVSVREGGMIKAGFDAELDGLLEITRGGRQWMAATQEEEIKRTGISSLKVRYNQVFGYYIEVTKPNLHLVPSDYIRKQTLVNAERFVTPALKEQEEKILTAEERICTLEYELFQKVRRAVLDETVAVQKNAALTAAVDALGSLAEAAARNRYVRPRVDDGPEIVIEDGRHPVLENVLPSGKFIPNDTLLDDGENQILIITGPNMAGKSTYIRQTALIVLMAQMGAFVPARSARIGIVDRIFTRVGAADDITSGMSTFMMEMSETAAILNNATRRSLIILDEIGRGTSTFDGLSIAWAVAEYLHEHSPVKARVLFATHYHELAELELTLKGVKNYNVAVREWNDEVIFLYKLMKGSSDHSYGIHVGRLAGLPPEVIRRAREILSNLEINSLTSDGIPSLVKSGDKGGKGKARQLSLFATEKENPVLGRLRLLDLNGLTPLEALNLLGQLKKEADGDGKD